MSFFGSFFGNDQRKDLSRAHEAATNALAGGYNDASRIGNDYYGRAMGQLAPWQESGRKASTLYDNALGVNGADAQQKFMEGYRSDPFRAANEQTAMEALRRTYNARGMDTSGNALLASARASLERGSQDYNNYLSRLQGQAGQGANMAQYGAGLTSQYGNALAGMRYGYGQQQAGNEISYGNARAATENMGWQNLIGLAGAAGNAYGAWNRK